MYRQKGTPNIMLYNESTEIWNLNNLPSDMIISIADCK